MLNCRERRITGRSGPVAQAGKQHGKQKTATWVAVGLVPSGLEKGPVNQICLVDHGKPALSSLGVLLDVALEMDFSTLRKKAFAALGAALAKNIAACFGRHTGTETVLAFADTLGRLVSAFHSERRCYG